MCNCINIKMGSYSNQITLKMPNGEPMGIDECIAEEIKNVWSYGIKTTGCCCGHNTNKGYIGVIDKDIEFMKKAGYKTLINKQNLRDESNFLPKSHYNNGKLNFIDYEEKYKLGGKI